MRRTDYHHVCHREDFSVAMLWEADACERGDAIERVRALHAPWSRMGLTICRHCHSRWPCPTIRALEDR